MLKLINKLLSNNNIEIENSEDFEVFLSSHKNQNSFLAITDTLDFFDINNLAVELPKTSEVLRELPYSFIASIITNESFEEVVLVYKKTSHFLIQYNDGRKQKITYSDFKDIWNGKIIIVEKEKKKLSVVYTKYLKNAFFIIPFILFFSHFNLLELTIGLLSLLGLITSIFISQKELGITSKKIEKFCKQKNNEESGCDKVLNSNAATIYKNVKISDLSLIYFTSLLVYLTLTKLFFISNILNIICYLSSISLIAVLYSIIYQSLIIKKWCRLCLVIIFILILKGYILFTYSSFSLENIKVLIISFFIVVAFWFVLKKQIIKSSSFKKFKIEHYIFKKQFSLFELALNNSRHFESSKINTINEITFGNKEAKTKLILITNPLCSFCKEANETLFKVLRQHNQDLQLTIRFNIILSDVLKDNLATKIASTYLDIYRKDKKKILLADKEFYIAKNYNDWLIKWQEKEISFDTENLNVLTEQSIWCSDNGLNYTPELLVNNKLFPEQYNINDLPLFIEEIIQKNNVKN